MELNPDFLVIGAGIAGMRAAIELAPAGRVLVVAKDALQESSSQYAQGGIAAALSDDDRMELHEQDTLVAGDGLCNPEAVRVLVEEGPPAIEQLIEWGVEFDRDGSKLLFAREGAHSRNRVLHARGDSTGREITRTLYAKAASIPNVKFQSFGAMTDLLVDAGGSVVGGVVFDAEAGDLIPIRARATLLATGGLGRLFKATTNPAVATGDGVAAAWRAGAEIADLEFVQFHPTALSLPGAPAFLLSEALRGEGAVLRNIRGERFMDHYHPGSELAPRDVVSRSIVSEMQATGGAPVFLDITHRDAEYLRRRFPTIYETCLAFGIDLAKDRAPIHPAAHYAMGGVWTDLDGRSTVERLYAAGEAACTGVHGANRLASNSLLEGLVFGQRAGAAMRAWADTSVKIATPPPVRCRAVVESEIRERAWADCGIRRDATGLARVCNWIESVPEITVARPRRELLEARNLATVLDLMATCALARQESRGGHYRVDFPHKDPALALHTRIRKGRPPEFA